MDNELNSDAWLGLRELREIQAGLVPELTEVLDTPLTAFMDDVERVLKEEPLTAIIMPEAGLPGISDNDRAHSIEDIIDRVNSMNGNMDPILVGEAAVFHLFGGLDIPGSEQLSAMFGAWRTTRNPLIKTRKDVVESELRELIVRLSNYPEGERGGELIRGMIGIADAQVPGIADLTSASIEAFLSNVEWLKGEGKLPPPIKALPSVGFTTFAKPENLESLLSMGIILANDKWPPIQLGSIFAYDLTDILTTSASIKTETEINREVRKTIFDWANDRILKKKTQGPKVGLAKRQSAATVLVAFEALQQEGMTETEARMELRHITGWSKDQLKNWMNLSKKMQRGFVGDSFDPSIQQLLKSVRAAFAELPYRSASDKFSFWVEMSSVNNGV